MWLRYDGPDHGRSDRFILSDGTKLPLGRPQEVSEEAAEEAQRAAEIAGHTITVVDGPNDVLTPETPEEADVPTNGDGDAVEGDQE